MVATKNPPPPPRNHSSSSSTLSNHWFWHSLRSFQQRHERIKHAVHTAWRLPLPPAGQAFMGFVYFATPVIGGWYVMQWAIRQSHNSIGEYGERLPSPRSCTSHTNQTKGTVRTRSSSDCNTSSSNELSPPHRVSGDTRVVRVLDNEDVVEQKVGAGGWGGGVHLVVSDAETQVRNQRMLKKYLRQFQPRNKNKEERVDSTTADICEKDTKQ